MFQSEPNQDDAAGCAVFLGLGSNLGDRARALAHALDCLPACCDLHVLKLSSLYETKPIGDASQPPYLNAVALGRTAKAPLDLLHGLERIERDAGRTRKGTWESRTLDLDILLYGEAQMQSSRLTLPHPRLSEREFVLAPLCEIAPEMQLPDGSSAAQLLREVKGTQGVALHDCAEWATLRATLARTTGTAAPEG